MDRQMDSSRKNTFQSVAKVKFIFSDSQSKEEATITAAIIKLIIPVK